MRATCACAGALLGVGASFEGIFRKHMVLPDSIRDSAWYAIIDDDWPRVKAMLEEKIDAARGMRCAVEVAPLRAEPDERRRAGDPGASR